MRSYALTMAFQQHYLTLVPGLRFRWHPIGVVELRSGSQKIELNVQREVSFITLPYQHSLPNAIPAQPPECFYSILLYKDFLSIAPIVPRRTSIASPVLL